MKLYLVRHAQPAPKEYTNQYPGPGLGSIGRKQAEWMARILAGKKVEAIWASDFTRVKESLKPFCEAINEATDIRFSTALREREPALESHESLNNRVKDWFKKAYSEIESETTAIFSHCGPLNMILESLDPKKERLKYPYRSRFGCHTPIAGIWEINLDSVSGKLIQCPIHEPAK
ncbi:MAG: histidine phosphatase family protein [Bacteroidota bacterium]